MSGRADAIRLERTPDAWTTAGVVAAGCAFLMLRLGVLGRPGSGPLLFAGYGSILVTATLVPVPRPLEGRPSTLAVVGVGLIGLVAVLAAAAVGGPSIPAAVPAWAPAMNTLAAVGEEALFRRAAYGGLERFGPVAAVVATAVLFAIVHVPVYGMSALPVDLGAGLLLGWQRAVSGTWSAPAATHVFANLVSVMR